MSGLFLNYIQVELENSAYKSGIVQDDKRTIKELIKDFPDWNFYALDGQTHFWAKTKNSSANNLTYKKVDINVNDQPKVFSKIIENSIVHFLKNVKNSEGALAYRVYKNEFFAWELISVKNEFEGIIQGLHVYRKITLQPLFLRDKDVVKHGFTLATNLKYKFVWQASDFLEKGIDISALEQKEGGTIVPNLESIYHFLNATGTKAIFDSKVAELESNENVFLIITKIAKWLDSKISEIPVPAGLTFKKISYKYLPYHGMNVSEIYSPLRYFYNNATNKKKLGFYNLQVKEYKPFSFGLFEDKEIQIAVVFPSEYEGVTEVFLKTLERSLKEDLHLSKLKYLPIKISNSSFEAYKDGIYNERDQLKAANLAIIIVNEDQEILPPKKSPYYYCKAKLIGQGIPTQDIQVETIRSKVHPLVLSNISLNVYGKLGGTAWTIEKEEKLKDELVIGIGSTTNDDGVHVLGIAQIFHPDGRYIVGSCSPLSTYEDYSKNLEQYLFKTLSDVIENHIDGQKHFRLIFHLFKSASEEHELKAIENVIKKFAQYKFDFVLLHLGYGHNFRIFQNDGKDKIKKGTFIRVTPNMALLHFVPDSILPLKIEIDKRYQGFNDLFYLAKQVYWFSSLSHRSYNPSKRTVTIMYPSLMAGLTEKLGEVEGWDYEMLEYVKDKQWFI